MCHDRTSRTGRNLVSSRSTSGLGFYWETITSIGSRIKRRLLIRSLDRSKGSVPPSGWPSRPRRGNGRGEEPGAVLAVVQAHICPQPVGQGPDNSEAKTAALGPASARNAVKAFEHSRPV